MANKVFDFKPWRYDRYDSPSSEVGSRMKDVLSSKYDENGILVVEKVGEEDVYTTIQSFAESCDLNVLMNRYLNGDAEALNKVQGFFGDFTEIPDSWAEVLNIVNRGQENFEKMPAEFKEKFGNDFARFVCTYDFSDFANSVVPDSPAPSEEVKESVADES